MENKLFMVNGASKSAVHSAKKISFFKEISRNRLLYLMLIPGVLITLVYRYLPMAGLVMAFEDFSAVKGFWGSKFVGLDHFKSLFLSKDFLNIFRNTLFLGLSKQLLNFIFALVLALLINELKSKLYKRTVQSITYFPSLLSWTVVGAIFTNMLQADGGIVNGIIKNFNPDAQAISFLIEPKFFWMIIISTEAWKVIGANAVIFIAAIVGINSELYEAAVVDGAGQWKKLWHITLPSIRTTMIVLAILNLQYVINIGPDQLMVFLSPNVYRVGEIIDTYVYRVGIQQSRYSYAAAAGFFKSVIALIIIVFANRAAKKIEEDAKLW